MYCNVIIIFMILSFWVIMSSPGISIWIFIYGSMKYLGEDHNTRYLHIFISYISVWHLANILLGRYTCNIHNILVIIIQKIQ